jgi:hypothetical protein
MNSQLYERLTNVAAAQSTVPYSELAACFGLDMSNPDDRIRLGAMLDEINHAEHDAGRPMISAVVVHAQEGLPGLGFFECARELNVLRTRNRQGELVFLLKKFGACTIIGAAPKLPRRRNIEPIVAETC